MSVHNFHIDEWLEEWPISTNCITEGYLALLVQTFLLFLSPMVILLHEMLKPRIILGIVGADEIFSPCGSKSRSVRGSEMS